MNLTEGEMEGGKKRNKEEWLNENEFSERNNHFNINISLQESLILEGEYQSAEGGKSKLWWDEEGRATYCKHRVSKVEGKSD